MYVDAEIKGGEIVPPPPIIPVGAKKKQTKPPAWAKNARGAQVGTIPPSINDPSKIDSSSPPPPKPSAAGALASARVPCGCAQSANDVAVEQLHVDMHERALHDKARRQVLISDGSQVFLLELDTRPAGGDNHELDAFFAWS